MTNVFQYGKQLRCGKLEILCTTLVHCGICNWLRLVQESLKLPRLTSYFPIVSTWSGAYSIFSKVFSRLSCSEAAKISNIFSYLFTQSPITNLKFKLWPRFVHFWSKMIQFRLSKFGPFPAVFFYFFIFSIQLNVNRQLIRSKSEIFSLQIF